MIKLNKNISRNQRGLTLIELMIAVAILAIVAIGLFQGFTTAFQSMGDSRDRTVATNYAQQIIEDYKNKPFQKILPDSNPIEGTKYFQNVIVSNIEYNLKKVIAQITWKDRNDNDKSITVNTLISNTQSIAEMNSIPAGIVIYAYPYNILPGTDGRAVPSHIYAEIVDENGNLIIDWDESNVEFSIISGSVIDLDGVVHDDFYLGTLRTSNSPIDKGVADTWFDQETSEEREGFVSIEASITIDDVKLYDTLTLKVTNEAVTIILTSDKEIISTLEGEEDTAHLTATIVDAAGDTVITDRWIDFSIVSGPETSSLESFVPTEAGVATVDLKSGSEPGTNTIVATSNLLESGIIDIQVVDPGMNDINVEAMDQRIVQQGSTEIIAKLTNYLGDPVSGETITFDTDFGDLSSESEITDGNGEAITTLTINFASTATVTASWIAEDSTLVSDSIQVECRNHNLYVSANPLTVTEGGSTTISVELTDADGRTVPGELINFSIIEGDASLDVPSASTNDEGIASVQLTIYSGTIAIVEANWNGDPTVVLGEVEVECTSAPLYQLELTAEKTTISIGETLAITAQVTENGNPVSDVSVTFTLNDYTNARLDDQPSSVSKVTVDDGIATVNLSGLVAGESVTVTAEVSEGGGSDSIIIACEVPEIAITLVPASMRHGTGNQGDRQVYFTIYVENKSINLEKMKITWTDDGGEKLTKLLIDDDEVYSNNSGANNGTIINFNQITPYTLNDGQSYEVKMIFKNDVINKQWIIAFINPETDEEIIPRIEFELN